MNKNSDTMRDIDVKLNFGALRESILRLSSRNFINEQRSGVDVFVEDINESVTLKKQHLVFNSLTTDKQFTKERLAERFINQTLKLMDNVSWEDGVLKENEKLRFKYLDSTHVGSTTEKDELFNAIHKLMEAKCMGNRFNDIESEQEAYELVINYLMESKEVQSEEVSDEPSMPSWRYVTKMAINNFNERYSHLSESDKELVKVLISDFSKKSNYLQDIKNENIEKLDKLINESEDDNDKTLFKSFKNKVELINTENITSIDEAIISCYELRNSIS